MVGRNVRRGLVYCIGLSLLDSDFTEFRSLSYLVHTWFFSSFQMRKSSEFKINLYALLSRVDLCR